MWGIMINIFIYLFLNKEVQYYSFYTISFCILLDFDVHNSFKLNSPDFAILMIGCDWRVTKLH
jgi:hypothetical protein